MELHKIALGKTDPYALYQVSPVLLILPAADYTCQGAP